MMLLLAKRRYQIPLNLKLKLGSQDAKKFIFKTCAKYRNFNTP